MAEKQSFERSLAELEETVRKMENEDITLDESIELFEKGLKLSRDCSRRLETARRRIMTLTDAEAEEEQNDD